MSLMNVIENGSNIHIAAETDFTWSSLSVQTVWQKFDTYDQQSFIDLSLLSDGSTISS